VKKSNRSQRENVDFKLSERFPQTYRQYQEPPGAFRNWATGICKRRLMFPINKRPLLPAAPHQ